MSRLIIKPRKFTRYGMLLIGSILPVMAIGLGLIPVFERGLPAFGSLPNIGEALLSLGGMTAMGAFFWLYFESSRYVVEDGFLSEKKFGLTLWKIESKEAEIEQIQDSGFTHWIVSNRKIQKRIGKIYCGQFYPADLQRLLDTLFPNAIREE